MKRGRPRETRRVGGAAGAERDQTMTEDAMMDFSIEELREFLQADLLDVPVDPRFKERLKRRLWELVERQVRDREPIPDD